MFLIKHFKKHTGPWLWALSIIASYAYGVSTYSPIPPVNAGDIFTCLGLLTFLETIAVLSSVGDHPTLDLTGGGIATVILAVLFFLATKMGFSVPGGYALVVAASWVLWFVALNEAPNRGEKKVKAPKVMKTQHDEAHCCSYCGTSKPASTVVCRTCGATERPVLGGGFIHVEGQKR